MKNEIDEACCNLAGISPKWYIIRKGNPLVDKRYPDGYLDGPYDEDYAESMKISPSEYGDAVGMVAEYPPVSTDWGAAGRLMEALRLKGVRAYALPMVDGWVGNALRFGEMSTMEQVAEDTGPMALCLAVARLATAEKLAGTGAVDVL